MHVLHAYYESTDRTLKTLELSFDNPQDSAAFFRKFNPGQFCQLSVFGKGESPIGVASAAWEGDFVRFTVQKMGAVTKALHKLQPGDTLGMRGPLGNGFPLEAWKGKNLVIIGGGCAFSTLYALTKHVQHPQNRPDFGQIIVIYGARSPVCACISMIFRVGTNVKIWKCTKPLISRKKTGRTMLAMCPMWSSKLHLHR